MNVSHSAGLEPFSTKSPVLSTKAGSCARRLPMMFLWSWWPVRQSP